MCETGDFHQERCRDMHGVGRTSAVMGVGWERLRRNMAESGMASARGAHWDSSA